MASSHFSFYDGPYSMAFEKFGLRERNMVCDLLDGIRKVVMMTLDWVSPKWGSIVTSRDHTLEFRPNLGLQQTYLTSRRSCRNLFVSFIDIHSEK